MSTPRQSEEITDIREARSTPSPEQSFPELIGKMTDDTSRLFRQEIALARAEMREDVMSLAVASAMIAVSAVLAVVALITLSFAAVEGLQRWLDIDIAWCYLIVGVLWVIAAVASYAAGRKKFSDVNPTPERALDEAKKIPQTLKGNS